MSIAAYTSSPSDLSIGYAKLNGGWYNAEDIGYGYHVLGKFLWGYGVDDQPIDLGEIGNTESGTTSYGLSGIDPDRTVVYQLRVKQSWQSGGWQGSDPVAFKSYANVMTFGTPNAINITTSSADVNVDFNPVSDESNAEVTMYYQKHGAGSWTNGGAIPGQAGNYSRNLQFHISGLDAGSLYHFYFHAARDSSNNTTLDSSTGDFTTASILTKVLTETLSLTETFTANLATTHYTKTLTETLTLTDISNTFAISGTAAYLDMNADIVQDIYMVEE